MSAIFISHSGTDRLIADDLARRLRQQGHRSIILDFDPELGIPAGRLWEKELHTQLRSASAVVVLCTKASMRSKWCFAEVAIAKSLGKPIFPIKVEECELDPTIAETRLIDLTTDAEGYQRLWRALLVAGLDPKSPARWDQTRAPYPGLAPFEDADEAVFFGREEEIRAGVEMLSRMQRLGGKKLAVLLGASGAGKSSLLRAGILPRLRREPDRWLILGPMRGLSLRELSLALASAFEARGRPRGVKELAGELHVRNRAGSGALVTIVQELLASAVNSEATVVLAIDQLEESLAGEGDESYPSAADSIDVHWRERDKWIPPYIPGVVPTEPDGPATIPPTTDLPMRAHSATLPLGTAPRVEYVEEPAFALLSGALADEKSPIVAIATLRSDYLAELQAHPIAGRLTFETTTIAPLDPLAWPRVIEGPAERAGAQLEPGLVQSLASATIAADAQALLAFTLRELWERDKANKRLTLATYLDTLGGLEGTLDRAAESVVSGEDGELRRSLLALARIGEDGRVRKTSVKERALPESARPHLEALVAKRLLIARGGPDDRRLEVAHEAVFRGWKRLRAWLDEERRFLDWRARFPKEGRLYGAELEQAKSWRRSHAEELTPEELQRIAAGERDAQRPKLVWGFAIGAIFAILIALLLADR